ncbi:MAG: ArsR/SmtB family transcription factor [Nocardioidaceae bacterium]
MSGDADIASVAAVLAEPTRIRILLALNNGNALTATELAGTVRVSRPAASFHLTKLVQHDLLTVQTRGRYRYFRLANEKISTVLEILASISPEEEVSSLRQGVRADQVRFGRICQNHIGGYIAVSLTAAFRQRGVLVDFADGYRLTEYGATFLTGLGIDLSSFARKDRFVERHPDWSESSHHMAGPLAKLVAHFMLGQDWLREARSSRAVRVTDSGRTALLESFNVDLNTPATSGND